MGKALEGKRIVIAGSQKASELGTIIEKQGGIPVKRALQGLTISNEKDMEQGLRRFVEHGADWIIFTTGIGAKTLYNAADKLSILPSFSNIVSIARIAARGYKTHAFLKKEGLLPIVSDDDGTIHDLIEKLEPYDFKGQRVMIQLHGEFSPELNQFMETKDAAEIQILLPYQIIAPERLTLKTLVHELTEGLVDAVCFTTRVQVRYLFDYARETGHEQEVRAAFERSVVAAAVGKVTAKALREEGIERIPTPDTERMGAMIVELSRYYSSNGQAQG